MYVDHVDREDVLKTFAISMSIRVESKFDHLILPNVIVHRRDTMSYWLTHKKHERIILVDDREDANVVERNHKHEEDNSMIMNENEGILIDNDDDENSAKMNHNDSNRYY